MFYSLFIGTGFILSAAALKFSLSFIEVEDWLKDFSLLSEWGLSQETSSLLSTIHTYESRFSRSIWLLTGIGIALCFLLHATVHYFRRREFRNYFLMGGNSISLAAQLVMEQMMLLSAAAFSSLLLFFLLHDPLMDQVALLETSLLESNDLIQKLSAVEKSAPPKEIFEAGPFTPQTLRSTYVHGMVNTHFVSHYRRIVLKHLCVILCAGAVCSGLFHTALLKLKQHRMYHM